MPHKINQPGQGPARGAAVAILIMLAICALSNIVLILLGVWS